jgi:Icc-related predicted phosphoesterase
MLKIGVCSDLMLDYRFKRINNQNAEKLSQIQQQNFTKLINSIIENKINTLIVVGNLFGTITPKNTTLKFVIDGFAKLKEQEIQVVILPGHQDTPLILANDIPIHYLFENLPNVKVARKKSIGSLDAKINEPVFSQTCGNSIINYYSANSPFIRLNECEIECPKKDDTLNIFLASDLTAYRKNNKQLISEFVEKIEHSNIDCCLVGGHLDENLANIFKNKSKIIHCPPIHPTKFDYLKTTMHGLKTLTFEKKRIAQEPKILSLFDIPMEQIVVDVNTINSGDINDRLLNIIKEKSIKQQIFQLKLVGEISRDNFHKIQRHKIVETAERQHIYFEYQDELNLIIEEKDMNKMESKSLSVSEEITNYFNYKIQTVDGSNSDKDNQDIELNTINNKYITIKERLLQDYKAQEEV